MERWHRKARPGKRTTPRCQYSTVGRRMVTPSARVETTRGYAQYIVVSGGRVVTSLEGDG